MIKYFILLGWSIIVICRILWQMTDKKSGVHDMFKTGFYGVLGLLIIFMLGVWDITHAS
ncbi:hypothetical protein phiAS5_ORF0234 [Aeromonas phage phiAS5]|uniref:Uncharacterized protein n=1 Tax=Aeromonas phage phiAS5 TaxID=879630 RepID=E1A1Y8_9CAUD|nr:hypothetical protein phiAS5_ORF0234 [Aeromonas phage phiAS5]ADM80077.1 hypothetical protein phiAS5_ORF0234 [Aeromonas phage phiAS5]